MPIVPAELYGRHSPARLEDRRRLARTRCVKIDELMIDIAGYEARIGAPIDLTHQEFELLRFLAQHRGRVFTRQALLERAWGYSMQVAHVRSTSM